MGAASSKAETNYFRERIRKELHQLWVDPPPFCRPGPSPVTDLFHWEVVIDGPEDSPYAGGTFPVDVQFSRIHPFEPTKITFKNKVYHPNINSKGKMLLDIFGKKWSACMTINQLLVSIVSVLYEPELDYPVHRDMALLYQRNLKLYEETARAWTRKYASTPVVSYYPEKGDEQWQEYCDAFAAHYFGKKVRDESKHREAERLREQAVELYYNGGRRRTVVTRARGQLNLAWRRTAAVLQGRSGGTVPSSTTAKKGTKVAGN